MLKSKVKMVQQTKPTTTWNFDKKIANHGEVMKLGSTPVEVKYGAYGENGGFAYKKLKGNVKCDINAFKSSDFDEIQHLGALKHCSVAAKAASDKKIADHGKMMSLGLTPLKSNMALTVQMAGLCIRNSKAMSYVVPRHSHTRLLMEIQHLGAIGCCYVAGKARRQRRPLAIGGRLAMRILPLVPLLVELLA